MRALSWEPHRKERNQTPRLCVGGDGSGVLFMLELGHGEPVKQRKLSIDNARLDDDRLKSIAARYLSTSKVRFAAGGRLLVTMISSDGGVEVYNLEKHTDSHCGHHQKLCAVAD